MNLNLLAPRAWLLAALFLALLASVASAEASSRSQADPNLRTIQKLFDQPEQRIDLALAKLTIDHIVDPKIRIAGVQKQLDGIALTIQSLLPPMATSRDKLEALRAYLYQSSAWNADRPYRYDLDDPFGRTLRNKLLPTYLATRKGNCVSMPLLFVILGQKIGLDVSIATAPEHMFVKYRDEQGSTYNLETTSGAGFTRDVWLQQQMPMSPEALANGIYMQPLGRKQTVAVMAGTLLEHYAQQGKESQRIALAKLILRHHPKDVTAMLHVSSAYQRLRQQHFVEKYPTPNDIPMEERAHFVELEKNIVLWRDKAIALGWRDADAARGLRQLND